MRVLVGAGARRGEIGAEGSASARRGAGPGRGERLGGAEAAVATLGLVDLEGPASEVRAVERAHGLVGGCVVHLDEGEAARAAGLAVHDDGR